MGDRPSIVQPPPPSITGLSPTSAGVGTPVTIVGTYFWSSQGSNTVTFNGTNAGTADGWSDGSITVKVPAGATSGNVVVTAGGVASNGMPFTVIPAPTLTAVSPASGVQGASVPVSLTGTNFIAGATVAVSNPLITAGGVTVLSAAQITANLTIDASAATGPANITVTTSGGTSSAVAFTVHPPSATNSLIVWDGTAGLQQSTVIALSNAFAAATPSYSVTTSVGVPGGSLAGYKQIWDVRCLDIDPLSNSDITAYRTYVAGGGSLFLGGSNATGSPSRDWSIASFVAQAGGGTVTPLNASNVESVLPPFTTAPDAVTSITFFNAGGSSTAGTGAFITKDTSPADGIGTGIVWAPGSLSNAPLGTLIAVFDANFIVNAPDPNSVALLANLIQYLDSPPPYIAGLNPASGVAGTAVTITGTNFGANQGGSTVTFNGVSAGQASSWNAGSITVNVPGGAATGPVVVTVGGTASNGVQFTVTPPAPTLTAVSPPSGAQGTSVPVTLTGTNFVAGATVAVSNPGVVAFNAAVVSATQITATLFISGNAATGPANVTATTSGGTSNAVVFTVNPSVLALEYMSPEAGFQGTSVPVTLYGSNFVQGATVAVSNPGIGAGSVTIVNAYEITAVLTISNTAAPGPANVTVTTSAGTSNAAVFTVYPPPVSTALIVWDGDNWDFEELNVMVNLSDALMATGSGVVQSVGVPGSLASYGQVWDVRAFNSAPVSAAEATAYVNYLAAGGSLLVLGENTAYSATRDASVASLVLAAGGGTITPVESSNVETVLPPFAAEPDPVTSITYAFAGGSASPGTGAFVTRDTNGDGIGTAIVWAPGTLANAKPGTLIAVFDWDFLNVAYTGTGGDPSSLALSANIAGYLNSPPPYIAGLNPASGAAGTPVTITGVNFGANQGGSAVTFNGVSAGQASNWTAGSITVNVPAVATSGLVVVTTSRGTSNAVVFTVNPPVPTLTAVTPNYGAQGATVTVALAGTNFVNGATAVSVANTGITVGAVTFVNATQLSVPFTISGTAALGATNVTVTTSGGTSNPLPFQVNPPVPTLTAVSPNYGAQGATVTVALAGTNFVNGATAVSVANTGITMGAVTFVNATQLSVPFTISGTAALGATNVTVTTSGGTSNPLPFQVNPPVPTLTAVTPNYGAQGATVTVALAGTNFVNGATAVSVANTGITVGAVTFVNATQLSVPFTISGTATLGPTNVTVTTAGGTSAALTFTVTGPGPTLTAVTPQTGVQGTRVSATLTGTNFDGSAKVAVSNPLVTASSVTVVSPTQIGLLLIIDPAAALGPANVTVTTGAGTSNPLPFTVTSSVPTLTSLSPTNGPQGATVSVTLTGTNFLWYWNPAVAVDGVGVPVNNVRISSDTQITANFAIDPAAAPGPHNVTVTTSGGTSNAMPFTVIAVPAISSLSTTTALGGSQVTINGSYFGTTQGTGAVWLGTAPATVVSWSNTQIAATVAANAQSGNARVRQNGQWSQPVTFTVLTPTITGVDPPKAGPGDTVTISGSNFGDSQGSGQVWLGTAAAATVKSWNNTQIVATVAANAQSGNAQVLQNGVMSNQWPLTVNTPQIASLSTASAAAGTSVTFTGLGFGAAGSATLGSMAGLVQSWNDNTVVAQVASGSVSGIARIQRSDGLWSNALGFTVPAAGGGGAGMATALMPSLLNMSVGDTRTLQALGVDGKAVTGQMWSTSDATVVSLSTDDPPLLTALAPGHVTIKAGSASADVTVWAGVLPVGTTIWSNPGNGSGVQSIVPAVPSPNGVADVFAFQQDGTVQAITADGTTAWTASVSPSPNIFYPTLPDFQGGLVVAGGEKIWKLDGITGQAYPAYSCGELVGCGEQWAVHTDGTIFTVVTTSTNDMYVVGIDPTSGAEKFRVAPAVPGNSSNSHFLGVMIAGDGYFYAPYEYDVGDYPPTAYFRVLRVGSDGSSADSGIYSWAADESDAETITWFSMITNADQGILISFETAEEGMVFNDWMATTGAAGTNRSQVSEPLSPMLQAQDGSFVGSDDNGNMVAFDASGNFLWVVPNETPAIATADGGVIGTSGIAYDSAGKAIWQTGFQIGDPWLQGSAQPSWGAQAYSFGPGGVSQDYIWFEYASSFGVLPGGNPSGTATAVLNVALAESVPQWDVQYSSNVISCTVGTAKVPFSTEGISPYTTAWGKELAFLTPPTDQCGKFFLSDGGRAQYYLGDQLTKAIIAQQPFDGVASTISLYAAGVYTAKDRENNASFPSHYKQKAVCVDFLENTPNQPLITLALAKTYPVFPGTPATDIYIDSRDWVLRNLTAADILHEALHNLTGLSDADLYELLTGSKLKGRPSKEISDVLRQKGCAPQR